MFSKLQVYFFGQIETSQTGGKLYSDNSPPQVTVLWICIQISAKGISILVGGQFLNWTSSVQNSDDLYFLGCSESKTEYCSLFRITSATVAAGATVVIVIYFVFGRKFEEKLLKKLNSDSKIGDTLKGDSLNAENEHHFWNESF